MEYWKLNISRMPYAVIILVRPSWLLIVKSKFLFYITPFLHYSITPYDW
jgi:hypothetical protein